MSWCRSQPQISLPSGVSTVVLARVKFAGEGEIQFALYLDIVLVLLDLQQLRLGDKSAICARPIMEARCWWCRATDQHAGTGLLVTPLRALLGLLAQVAHQALRLTWILSLWLKSSSQNQ